MSYEIHRLKHYERGQRVVLVDPSWLCCIEADGSMPVTVLDENTIVQFSKKDAAMVLCEGSEGEIEDVHITGWVCVRFSDPRANWTTFDLPPDAVELV